MSEKLQADGTGDWRNGAECLNEDPELFFPIGVSYLDQLKTEEAKQVCGRCEVREECLNWALGNDERYGIWGGLTEAERSALTRRQSRKPAI